MKSKRERIAELEAQVAELQKALAAAKAEVAKLRKQAKADG